MAEIICVDNGPYRITGEFQLKDASGKVFDVAGRQTISLCRCGHSQNKPFCDGSHRKVNFESAVQARALPPPAR